MTVPTWRSKNTFASGTGNVTPSDMPAGFAANDILLIIIQADEAGSISTPSGYTQVGTTQATNSGTTGSKVAVFYKRATGSETPPTITDTGDHTGVSIHAISGCILSGSPIDAVQGTVDNVIDGNLVLTGITTGVNDALVMFVASTGIDATGSKFSNYGWPTNIISPNLKREDSSFTAGEGGNIGVWSGAMGAAGSIGGNFTADIDTSFSNTRKAGLVFSLIPETASIDNSDSGTSSEDESISGTTTDTDTGTGTESEVVGIPISDSDSGTGTEGTEHIEQRTHHIASDNFNRGDETTLSVSSSGAVWTNV